MLLRYHPNNEFLHRQSMARLFLSMLSPRHKRQIIEEPRHQQSPGSYKWNPGPIPTFTPSAPASTKNLAASPVAIFPTTTSISGYFAFISFNTPITPLECPCAVSITMASTPASTKRIHTSRSNRLSHRPPQPHAADLIYLYKQTVYLWLSLYPYK